MALQQIEGLHLGCPVGAHISLEEDEREPAPGQGGGCRRTPALSNLDGSGGPEGILFQHVLQPQKTRNAFDVVFGSPSSLIL